MRWLALVPFLLLTNQVEAQSSPDSGTCVTTSLQIIYFGLEAPERSLAITENLQPPDDDFAAEPAPAPPPLAPDGGSAAGGGPTCDPLIRPADDPIAQQICKDALTYGLWTCDEGDNGTIVIEDIRYVSAASDSHRGTKN